MLKGTSAERWQAGHLAALEGSPRARMRNGRKEKPRPETPGTHPEWGLPLSCAAGVSSSLASSRASNWAAAELRVDRGSWFKPRCGQPGHGSYLNAFPLEVPAHLYESTWGN